MASRIIQHRIRIIELFYKNGLLVKTISKQKMLDIYGQNNFRTARTIKGVVEII